MSRYQHSAASCGVSSGERTSVGVGEALGLHKLREPSPTTEKVKPLIQEHTSKLLLLESKVADYYDVLRRVDLQYSAVSHTVQDGVPCPC